MYTSIVVGTPTGKKQMTYGSAFLWDPCSCEVFSITFCQVHLSFFLPSLVLSSMVNSFFSNSFPFPIPFYIFNMI